MVDPRPKRKATYQDILDAAKDTVAEIINGDLRLSPRPGLPHTGASACLSYVLAPPFHFGNGGPGGWIILPEPELHLDDDVVVPDLAGWRRERMPQLAREAFTTMSPDWVCETLSKSTEKLDRAEKLPIYARSGVRHVWLIDPRTQTLEVYRRQDDGWPILGIHHGDQKVRAEPFEVFELDLSLLWADVEPQAPKGTRAAEAAAQYEYGDSGY
jgi:hypothetical protein